MTGCSDVCEAVDIRLRRMGFKISDEGDDNSHDDMLEALDKVTFFRDDAQIHLLAALETVVSDEDADWSEGGMCCRWCGRPFDKTQLLCTSDDCRGFIARAAIAAAKGGIS